MVENGDREGVDYINISMYDLNCLCLGLVRAVYHSTDMFDKNRDTWLAEEFFVYMNMTREQAIDLADKFYPYIEAYQKRLLQEKLEAEMKLHGVTEYPTYEE
jgi:hypothetical protein